MNTDKPEGYVNATEMAHPAADHSAVEPPRAADPETDPQEAATAEQEAKRIEKIRSHASSHHTAGTVRHDT